MILLYFTFMAFSKTQYADFLPLEFNFMLVQIQQYELHEEELKKIEKRLKTIDSSLDLLPKEVSIHVIKSNIYKTLLEITPNLDLDKKSLEKDSFKIINDHYLKYYKDFHIFTKWLIESIQSDIWNILSDKKYKNSNNIKKYALKWFFVITEQTPKQLNLFLRPVVFDIISKLSFQLKTISSFRGEKITEKKKFKNFKISLKKANSFSPANDWNLYRKMKRIEALKIMEKIKVENDELLDPMDTKWSPKK